MLRLYTLVVINVRSSCLDVASVAGPSYLVESKIANNDARDLVDLTGQFAIIIQ